MYQQFQHCMAVAAAVQLGAKTALMRFPSPVSGSVVQVLLINKGPVNSNGDSVFDVNVNGTTIFTDQTTRPKILSGASTGSKSIVKGTALIEQFDEVTVDLDTVPAGGIGGPLYMVVVIDNSLTVSRYVRQMYLGGMGRVPTTTEQTNGESSLNTALALNTLAVRVACSNLATLVFGSSEYIARARTDTQYVSDLYAGILGRDADGPGLAANLATLTTQGGTNSRADLRGAFTGSTEHINVRVAELSGNVVPYGDAQYIGGIPVALSGTPADQDVIKYDLSTGKWVNGPGGGGGGTLAGNVTGPIGASVVEKIRDRTINAMPGATTVAFADDFNDNSLDPNKWTVVSPGSAVLVREQSSRLEIIPVPSTVGFNYVDSAHFDARDRIVTFEFPNLLNDPVGFCEYGLYYITVTGANYIQFYAGGGAWYVAYYLAGVAQGSPTVVATPAVGDKFRIRHVLSTSTLYVEQWSGASWVTRHTISALGFTPSNIFLEFYAGYWGTGNGTTSGRDRLAIDNFDAGGATIVTADTLATDSALLWNPSAGSSGEFEPKVITSRIKTTTGVPSGPPANLPAGYTEMRWRESTGLLYIWNPVAATWSTK